MEPYIAYEKANGQNSIMVLDFDWESDMFMLAMTSGSDNGEIGFMKADEFTKKYRYKNLV